MIEFDPDGGDAAFERERLALDAVLGAELMSAWRAEQRLLDPVIDWARLTLECIAVPEGTIPSALSWALSPTVHCRVVIEREVATGNEYDVVDPQGFSAAHLERIRRLAVANTEAMNVLGFNMMDDGVIENTQPIVRLDAACLMLPNLFDGWPFEGSPVAFAPTRSVFVVADEQRANQLVRAKARAAMLTEQAGHKHTLSQQPWILKDGAWRPWDVPADHPFTKA